MDNTLMVIVAVCLIITTLVELFFAALFITAMIKLRKIHKRFSSIMGMVGMLGLGGAKFISALLGIFASKIIGTNK